MLFIKNINNIPSPKSGDDEIYHLLKRHSSLIDSYSFVSIPIYAFATTVEHNNQLSDYWDRIVILMK